MPIKLTPRPDPAYRVGWGDIPEPPEGAVDAAVARRADGWGRWGFAMDALSSAFASLIPFPASEAPCATPLCGAWTWPGLPGYPCVCVCLPAAMDAEGGLEGVAEDVARAIVAGVRSW